MNIAIVGTGKIGLCMALCLDQNDYNVSCYDINNDIINGINNKTISTIEPYVEEYLKKSNLKAYNDNNYIESDIIIVVVQTPSLSDGGYDHKYIDNIIEIIISKGKQENPKTLIISCTVMPEYCNSIYNKIKDLNYNVCYNPLFIAQSSIISNILNPDIILIGETSTESGNIIEDIYKKNIKNNATICKMSLLEAEITKISLNCFITAKITFANMIGDLAKSVYCNPDIILNAIGTDSRVGNKYLKYGYGFGGPCFPRDNLALYNYGISKDMDLILCNTTDNLNNKHLIYQFNELKHKKEITFDYITYKDNSTILDESQKLKLALLLSENGSIVTINERIEIINILKEKYGDKFIYKEKIDF